MSLSKETTVDKIEVTDAVDLNGNTVTTVQVREKIKILENSVVISESFNRYAITSGDTYSDKPARVRSICDIAFPSP